MDENGVINEKLLAENSDFLKAVVKAKTIEEARSICVEYNIELPDDVWKKIQDSYCNGNLDIDELSDDDLDAVSGGGQRGKAFLNLLGGVAGLGAAIAMGSPLGILVAFGWIGYYAYTTFG